MDESLSLATDRLNRLQALAVELSAAVSIEQVAAVLVQAGISATGAKTAGVWQRAGDVARMIAPEAHDPATRTYREIPFDVEVGITHVLKHGTPLWFQTHEEYAQRFPTGKQMMSAVSMAVEASCVLPLETCGKLVGAVGFTYSAPRAFDDGERAFLLTLARHAAIAFERARLYEVEAEARRSAEAENTRKDELLAMLGHELRNPLAAMLSAMDLLRARNAVTGRELMVIDRQLNHLVRMVGDLVDVSRVTRGEIRLERRTVDVGGAVAHAVETCRALIDGRGHVLAVDVPSDLVVDADRDRLAQVLSCLLQNAAQYTREPGRIEVTARADGDVVVLSVRDSGTGISPEMLPQVFDLFVQGPRAMDRMEGGLGIGLTFVRTLVELHGGKVSAHSDGLGTGATFSVHWPRASSRTITSKIPAIPKPELQRLRVLIVDDNIDAAHMFSEVLKSLGHETVVAYDGDAALRAASELEAHVAFLDIGLPEMDGYELATRLRELPTFKSTRLIAITGYGTEDDRDRSVRAGFSDHLVKPIGIEALAALLTIS
jgi:signal transduction histidine kinase/CheY-like chemotaxis protein